MGTNFYVDAEPTCNNPAHTETLHIGKSSMGWEFCLRGHAELGLINWPTWRTYLQAAVAAGRMIRDEYDREIDYDDLEHRILRRFWDRDTPPRCHHSAESRAERHWVMRDVDPEVEYHCPPDVDTGPHGVDVLHREFS